MLFCLSFELRDLLQAARIGDQRVLPVNMKSLEVRTCTNACNSPCRCRNCTAISATGKRE